MNTIKCTKSGHDALIQRLNSKRAEFANVQKERAEALRNTTDSDMNDPELVALQQNETALSATVAHLEALLSKAKVVDITDSNRNTDTVQVGSIIEIQRINSDTGAEQALEIWEISGYDETDVKQRMLAYNSPLANQLIGFPAGESVFDVIISGQAYEVYISKLFKSWTDV